MTILRILVSAFLSWAAFDRNLFRARRLPAGSVQAPVSLSWEQEQVRKAKRNQHRLNVIPQRYRRARTPLRSKCKYHSVKSRDVRDSDQRKIRRRFNNM